MLTEQERDELVERINANPNLQPMTSPTETGGIVERLRDAANGLFPSSPLGDYGVCDEAAALIEQQVATNAELVEAAQPFADFADLAGAAYLPDDHVITLGSGMAARQLTMGDCRRIRAALAKAPRP